MTNIAFFRCTVCGNIMVHFLHDRVKLKCCEQSMTKLEPNADGAEEIHIPVVMKESDNLHVEVGAQLHPMLPEHHIELIVTDTFNTTEISYLKPGMEPKADFKDGSSTGTVYEYCNVHGLWKTEF
ncbi:MAG: desulfoferrodoxin family protein [Eubacteriales bacterium]